MKYLLVFFIFLITAIIISCSTINFGKDSRKKSEILYIIDKPNLAINKPVKPVVFNWPDTVHKYYYTETIKNIDTATLSIWFNDAVKKITQPQPVTNFERQQLMELIQESLAENELLIKKYFEASKDKQIAEEKIEKTQKVITDIPSIMYVLILLAIITAKLRYARIRTEKQIREIQKRCNG